VSRRLITPLAVVAVGLAVFFLELVAVTGDPGPTGLDSRALTAADDLNSGAGVAVAKVVTAFGSLPATAVAVLIGAVLLARRRRRAELAVLLGSAVAIYVLVHVTKAATDRPRPPHPLAAATLSAFPSGHAAYSTMYVGLASVTSRASLLTAAVVAAAAIAASRVYLRVHWASDVLAGWALGAAIFGAATAIALAVGRFRNNDRATCTQP
jgi:undecaprenyl-diphosphatase